MIKSILITLFVLGLAACGSSKNNSSVEEVEEKSKEIAIDTCIKNGIKYYQNLGSYPTLSTGESADLKIRDKCNFNTNIFD